MARPVSLLGSPAAPLVEGFRSSFGREPVLVAHAPGRVNLIGEHTDYNGGFAMPAAISLGVWLAAARADGAGRLVSHRYGPAGEEGWGAYPEAVAWALSGRVPTPALDAYVWSDLPPESGLSSSAALELAFAQAWNWLAGSPIAPLELALLCQRAENERVGVQCGAMDQIAAACGKEDCALLLDARSNQVEPVPLPSGLAVVVCDTGTPRTLAGSVYNQRRAECAEAASLLGVPSLREATEAMVRDAQLPGPLDRRARHVVEENARVLEFASALRTSDRTAVARLMLQSHESLRNNYEVSTVELDRMASAARQADGCWGARMTGAGLGGACVALVEESSVDRFVDTVSRQYRAASPGGSPSWLAVAVAAGAEAGPWSGPSASQGTAGKTTRS